MFVTALLSDGSRRDVTGEARVTLSTPVARVLHGRLEAVRDGRGVVLVRFGGLLAQAPVVVAQAQEPRRVSFRYDVLPVISKAGCNQGSCHGNGEGRGGLKLSLKGEDPVGDYQVLATHGARRVSPQDPARSLLLTKATSALPHGGGMRFKPQSREYQVLAAWIAAGARDDAPGAPVLTAMEVGPTERIHFAPATMQRLTVTGRFSDGSVRDLTEQAVFSSSDPAIEVEADGLVRSERGGDSAVLVRYADQLRTARLTFVPQRQGFRWQEIPAVNGVDELHWKRLKTLRLNPSRPATDSEFLRRAYLDACGILPTPEEVRAFLKDPSADKRSKLVDALLQRPEFDEFWAMKWGDILRSEERTLDPKGIVAYRDWIKNSIASRKPMDQFARELLTANGGTYQNPPANYYRRTRLPVELAETTAQVFMGTRLLCAKCHNHPTERWKQEDYYSLAAFFARVERKGELTRKDKFDLHELIGEETISVAAAGEVKNPRSGKQVVPRIPDAPAIRVGDGADRREVFAGWLTAPDNPYFAKAMVNRVWYYLMGKGIIDPVDDIRESNPASNPELLARLTRDFVASKFDLKSLVRTIMVSQTYALSSEPNAQNGEDDRFFSRALPQRLSAEVLLDAISHVTGSPEKFDGFPEGTRATQLPAIRKRKSFLTVFGQPTRETVCECDRSNESTLGQSFELISGGTLDTKLKAPSNRIGQMIAAGKSDAAIITELYLAGMSREPSPRELQDRLQYLQGKPNRREVLEDLTWALINSKEFLLRR